MTPDVQSRQKLKYPSSRKQHLELTEIRTEETGCVSADGDGLVQETTSGGLVCDTEFVGQLCDN